MSATAFPAGLVGDLQTALGPDAVLADRASLVNRARVPAPFPVHDWAAHLPDVVVLPRTTADVVAVARLANVHGVPIVPRAGGTGLADGAVPLRGGILVDLKRMNRISEVDFENRTVRVQAGVGLRELHAHLTPLGLWFPDDPSSFPCALVGGRIGTSGWSHLAARYGHTRDLVISMEVVLPTGDVVEVGEGGGRGIRKSSTGYALKGLFFGHQGTLGITTEATLELHARPQAEFTPMFAFPDFEAAHRTADAFMHSGLATIAGIVFIDDRRVAFGRREGAFPEGTPEVGGVAAAMLYGSEAEVRAAGRVIMRIAESGGARYLGDEVSQREWAARHLEHLAPLHGRLPDGQVVPMTWHVQDAACPSSAAPELRGRWHAIVDRYVAEYGIFDNWGMAFHTNAAFRPWGDLATTIEIGIWEQAFDEARWRAWVDCELELGRATIACGGSVSNAHGATREGSAPLVPLELGSAWPLMKLVKRTLDPNNVMNPGTFGLDEAYRDVDGATGAAP
jgi:glycolate oxidase